MGLEVADYAVLVVYFLALIAIGVNESRKIKSSGDYFMPRKFGKIMMTFFAFGGGTHADQAVTVAAKSYTAGLSGIWYQWLYLPVTPFYWLIAPVLRRFRAITISDVLELRYNRSVSMLYTVMGSATLIVTLGLMLKGSGEVLAGSTGGAISSDWIIVIITALFLTYGTCGGLAAAIYIDFLQGILIIIFSFMLLPLIMNSVGGFDGLRSAAEHPDLLSLVAPSGIGVFYITVLAINALVGVVGQPHLMGNCGAGKTELEGRFGLTVGNVLKRLCTIPWCLIGVAGVLYFAGREVHPDNVFGLAANEFLSRIMPGLLGVFIAGVIASVMSTCDAIMIGASALLTENLYRPLVPGKSKKHYVWAGRASCSAIVAASLIFAYMVPDVVTGLEIFWKVTSMMGIAFWIGFFWNKATTAGAWASTLAALGTWWLTTHQFFMRFVARLPLAEQLKLVLEKDTGLLEFSLPWQMIFYLTAGLIAGIVVSLVTKPVAAEKLERYYALVRTPIKPDEVIEESCHIPEGTPIPPARKIFPGTSIEILVPSKESVVGFIVFWLIGALLVLMVYGIARM